MPFVGGIAGAAAGLAAGAAVAGAAGLANGVGAQPSSPGATGRMRIEPEQLDAAIQIFQNALDSVEMEVAMARQELLARPPANDEVSVNAAAAFNRVGVQNANSAITAWEGCVQQLQSIIQQLRAAKETNIAADTDNSSFLRN